MPPQRKRPSLDTATTDQHTTDDGEESPHEDEDIQPKLKQKKTSKANQPIADEWIWEWAGDSKGGNQDIWIKYDAKITKRIEEAYQNKEKDFELDKERFIDFKDMFQRRFDSKNKKRAIRRRSAVVDANVDEKDLSMVFRIYDEHGRGKIDSDELNSIVRALGQEDMEDSEKPQGLVDFSTVAQLVKARGKQGKMRTAVSGVDGLVKKNLMILKNRISHTPTNATTTTTTTKAKKGKKAAKKTNFVNNLNTAPRDMQVLINPSPEPDVVARTRIHTFYNKSAMLHTKDEIDATSVDRYDNVSGNEHDLGKDKVFSGYVVLIGAFYDEGILHGEHGICTKSVASLMEKGFNVIITYKIPEFIQHLQYADVAWMLSGAAGTAYLYGSIGQLDDTNKDDFRRALIDFHKNGGGLCIWADNEPYIGHANEILQYFKAHLTGNTPGAQTLKLGNGRKKGQFSRHLLTSGIANLFEGVTICYPDKQGNFELLGTSTNDNPVILYMDHEPRGTLNKSVGRVVVDCAFTKLYINWDTAGTARYVANISVWLLGLDTKMKTGVSLDGVLAKKALK